MNIKQALGGFTKDDGCLSVGKTKKYFKKSHEFEIRQSRKVYIPLYKRLAAMKEKGEVFIISQL